jgi:AcrR family transcriptional regulator
MTKAHLDIRIQRTRAALLRAFFDLVQTHRYENLQVADISARARVSRSTFYAHFRSKDALLATSIAVPFSALADTVMPEADVPRLQQLLEHFWGNRTLARSIFLGSVRSKAIEVLIRGIEDRLKSAGPNRRDAYIVPRRLVAIQLSEILLAPITAWLLGESKCTSERLAIALRRVSIAALEAARRPTK